jgi:hypothetical protein
MLPLRSPAHRLTQVALKLVEFSHKFYLGSHGSVVEPTSGIIIVIKVSKLSDLALIEAILVKSIEKMVAICPNESKIHAAETKYDPQVRSQTPEEGFL